MQDDAERVHIGRGGDGPAVDLLRRGELRGQHPFARRAALGLALQQLGDAEVQQFGLAPVRHEDVPGLEVAVHHQVLVRALHRGADLQEQAHAIAQAERMRVAPAIDRFAVDQFHREVRRPGIVHAAVEQRGDVRVLQAGQDLAFAQEAPAQRRLVQADANALDGGLLLEAPVDAFAAVDRTHASVADHPGDAPWSDASFEQRIVVVRAFRRQQRRRAAREHAVIVVRDEQRLDFRVERGVLVRKRPQASRALYRIEFDQFVEQRQCALLEPGRVHPMPARDMSNCRKARALRQSRRTVRSVNPSADAISASLMPAK